MSVLLSILSLVGFVALTAGTALFVAAEFSLTALERSTVDAHARDGDRRARQVQHAHRTLSFQLSGAQLGITITTLITGYLAEPVLARFLNPLLQAVGLSESTASGISLALALILATSFSMIFGELVPKNLAIAHPLGTARATAGLQVAFSLVFKWAILFLNGSANWVVRRLGIELSHPDFLVEGWLKQLGDDGARRLLNANNRRKPLHLLAFRDRGGRELLAESLIDQGCEVEASSLSPIGLKVRSGSPLDTDAYRRGDFYVQDEWRVNRRLTLTLGLRYELHQPWVETRNGWGNFDIDTDPRNPAIVPAVAGSRADRATIRPDNNDLAPRFGFAYRASDKTVIRGGMGVYFTQYEAMGGGEPQVAPSGAPGPVASFGRMLRNDRS